MRTLRALLLVLVAVAFGLHRVLRDVSDVRSVAPVIIFGALIVVWFPLSRMLIKFVDTRNRSNRLVGFAGFVALLGAILAAEWISFVLKGEISPARDASTSFLEDAAWLIIFPFVFYRITTEKKVSRVVEPTHVPVPCRADAHPAPSTRATHL